MYVGGGAAIGGILGALLGGGKGAGIGAILGGAGGAGAEVLNGKKKEVPAETELSYKLAEDLQMHSVPQ
jgi:outer membrane lipoprotein SlyB